MSPIFVLGRFMETKEKWKDIPGYEGYYKVSSFGRVKSLAMEKTNHSGGAWIEPARLLQPATNKGGYSVVVLVSCKKSKSFLVHRLVALAFLGKSDLEVNHKDKNTKNNKLSNLEYVTKRENISHKFDKTKTSSKRTGVYFNKQAKKFQACISLAGKNYNLGLFDTEEEAGNEYDRVLAENGITNRYSRH